MIEKKAHIFFEAILQHMMFHCMYSFYDKPISKGEADELKAET